MDAKLNIRHANIYDAEGINNCTLRNLAESDYLLTSPSEFHPSVSDTENWIQFHIDKPNSSIMIASHDNQVIAVQNITGKQTKKVNHTADFGLAILPEYRGQGVGKKMVEFAISWAKENNNLKMLTLEVFSANKPAFHLYKSFGFEQYGFLPKAFFQDGKYLDNVLMKLEV
ncbi:MAG: GNAT family N-acetyltransferase [Bacteroidetes bacterium]|nr:GNAT family N-acetyltransferase [Bacteroidota bacterium]